MTLPDSIILVCAGEDTAHAAASGHPLLDLRLTVTAQGHLYTMPGGALPGGYLGLRDPGAQISSLPAENIAQTLLRECRRTRARGAFADLESDTESVRALCGALDAAFHEAGMPLFVPYARAEDAPHAVITLATAVSGGSLSEHLAQAQQQFGAARVAALLQRVSADFCMPSPNTDGAPLAPEQREALRRQHRSHVFFSQELCAQYFTYMDESRRGHFVLFDDANSWHAKLRLLDRLRVPYCFALYPDATALLRRAAVTP